MTVLDTIGRTRLLPLRRMVREGSARVLIKLETVVTLAVDSGMKYLSTALYSEA